MSTKYAHLALSKDVETGIAGYYIPEKEVRLKYNGREVLYVTGQAVVEAACHDGICGVGKCLYAIVPGYILQWQNEMNKDGLPVSEVEPILDGKVQVEIRKIIQTTEAASPIAFW